MAKAFLNSYISDTPEQYLFVLTNSEGKSIGGETDPITPPLEWATGSLQAKRRLNVGGVFINYSLKSLTFIKKGNDFIRKEFATNELNSIMNMTVKEWNEEIGEYEAFPIPFAFNFDTYKQVKVGKTEVQIGVNIEAVSNGNVIKFDKRKKTKVDLTKTVSIGGFNIVPYSNLKKDINIPEVSVTDNYESKQSLNESLPRLSGSDTYVSIPMGFSGSSPGDIYFSDFQEAKIVSYANQLTLEQVPPFFENATEDYVDVTFKGSFSFNVTDKHSGTPPWEVRLIEVNSGDTIINNYLLGNFGNSKGFVNIFQILSIPIGLGNSLKMVVKVLNIQDIAAFITFAQVIMIRDIAISDAITVEGLPRYKAFERVMQHVLDSQYPFYSEKYGTLDDIYNLNGDKYLSEDQKTFVSVMSGLNFRSSPLSDPNTPIPASFEDLFQSSTSMDNLGYMFELRDDFFRLRIEDYSFFFDDEVVLDLSDRLTDLDIEGEAMPELAYLDIQTGYKKYEYEKINGRGEFNTTSGRTSIINTDTKYDNVSIARADTKAMLDLIANPIDSTGTTDVKGDNDLFFLKTQRDGSDWKPEKQENITIEDDSSIFGDSTFNLFLTPTRNLIRQGNKLKSALIKFVSSFLRFQVSDKLQTLKTTGEGYTITENDDILVDDLADPIFKAFKWKTKVKLTSAERKAFILNPRKRIIFTEKVSGWNLDWERVNASDEVEIDIIEKYVN